MTEEEWRKKLYAKGIFLITDINFKIIDELARWILSNRPQKNKFTILINSSGGSPAAVIGFASFLCTLEENVEITGVVFNVCGSAALALLQCCHTRIAVKHCTFFVHHIHTKEELNCRKTDLKKIKITLATSYEVEEEIVEIQCKRIGMTKKQWMALADDGEHNTDRPIFTKRALKLGLVDKIVSHFSCF
ncbi:ATP-dependent Clp protease proteolytic subunit [Patescibacteria group bacterium]